MINSVSYRITFVIIVTASAYSVREPDTGDPGIENAISEEENMSTDKSGITVEEHEVIFKYFNRDYMTGEQIYINNVSAHYLRGWKTSTPLKIITHGWLSSEKSPAVKNLKEAYLEKTDYNIITVDWSEPASWKTYPLPAYMTYQVGGIIAKLIDELIKQKLVSEDDVHVIGHSLGSHVAGATGAQVKNGKIARITGLDPAGPAFEAVHYITKNVLDINDAKFVDVIHTASGAAGYYNELGHADFYPNGGTPIQPGCLEEKSVSGVMSSFSCSHGRAYDYFRDSIAYPHSFKAYKCHSWDAFKNGSCDKNETAYMGDETPPTAQGIYYLQTRSTSPFGLDYHANDSNEENYN